LLAPPSIPGNWSIAFDDEFNSTTLNPVWHTAQYWDTTSTVVGGGELEAYDSSGVTVSGGELHLTARADNSYGVPYVSGMVNTGGEEYNPSYPSFSFLHGYMEVRAKIPSGQGLWPALWLMPASHNDSNGEIDALEVLGGSPSTAYFTVHRNGNYQQVIWNGIDLSQGFHTYGMDWEADHVSWYIDGTLVGTMTNTSLICPEAMYPIMNLAVGGSWGGPPNAATQFPASMDVDYIRIWQQTS
jgi:beta-glucanase (GH16 family)